MILQVGIIDLFQKKMILGSEKFHYRQTSGINTRHQSEELTRMKSKFHPSRDAAATLYVFKEKRNMYLYHPSMYGIFTCIYHKNQFKCGWIYQYIHESYGYTMGIVNFCSSSALRVASPLFKSTFKCYFPQNFLSKKNDLQTSDHPKFPVFVIWHYTKRPQKKTIWNVNLRAILHRTPEVLTWKLNIGPLRRSWKPWFSGVHVKGFGGVHIWMFPKIGVPQNGWWK